MKTYTNKCKCGFYFLSRHADNKICPQCRDNINGQYIELKIKTCICCGKVLDKNDIKYCCDCRQIVKKSYNRIYNQCRPDIEITSQINESNTERSCGVDASIKCENCPYDDCVLPVDIDDNQGELF